MRLKRGLALKYVRLKSFGFLCQMGYYSARWCKNRREKAPFRQSSCEVVIHLTRGNTVYMHENTVLEGLPLFISFAEHRWF